MKSFAWPAGLLVALSSLSLLEAPASACSPPLPGLNSTLPAEGESFPANSAILFYGYSISLGGVTVTVDGQPATLMPAGDVAVGELAARVMPEPMAGQTVTIEGDFCQAPDTCPIKPMSFMAAAADAAAPAAPASISFDIHDYPDFKSSGGDCQSDSDLAFWIHVASQPPAASESPVQLHVEASRDDTFQQIVFAHSTLVSSASTTLGSRQTINVLNGANAPEALCFRASLRDLAGNAAGGTVQVCEPCNYRKEAGMATDFMAPPEPMWGPADIYSGGPCDNGMGGSGGGGGGAGGAGGQGGGAGEGGSGEVCPDGSGDCVKACSCQAAGAGGSGAGLAALAMTACAALAGRRRRSIARR